MDDKPQLKYVMTSQDIFRHQYEHYRQSNLAERLKRKYAPIPYYLKFKVLRQLALVSSYVFNFFSGLTAASLVFLFVYGLSEWLILTAIVTVLFLGILELAKRLVCTSLLKDWCTQITINIPMFFFALVLSGLSISFSYFGSQQMVMKLAPSPTIESVDTLIKPLENKIAIINTQIDAARSTKYRGTTTTSSQRTIELLTVQLAPLENEIFRLKRNNEDAMLRTQALHHQYTTHKAWYFALVTLVLELFFFLSIWYLEYYDFRSYIEMTSPQITVPKQLSYPKQNNTKAPRSSLNNKPKSKSKQANNLTSQEEIRLLRSRMATAKYRLKNGVGKRETAERNLEKFAERLEILEKR